MAGKWTRARLQMDYTTVELIALSKQLEEDPANKAAPMSLYHVNKKTQTKLTEIGWAITQHMIDKKRAAGIVVEEHGYSGRQTNRR